MPHAFLYAERPATLPLHCSKQAFEASRDARRAMNNMNKNAGPRQTGEGTLDVYRCASCGLWHVGHKKVYPRKKEA